jgi:hypothetical protein
LLFDMLVGGEAIPLQVDMERNERTQEQYRNEV